MVAVASLRIRAVSSSESGVGRVDDMTRQFVVTKEDPGYHRVARNVQPLRSDPTGDVLCGGRGTPISRQLGSCSASY